ncbi:hypothetical protein [Nocardia abscessus]|uniref:hypothetical protein n=1 Tax=Nocardia abscessus TaxID=120957 RepID=UPI0024554D3A|nr:hypothetical protein [Nocardia abscessus]
MANIKQAVEQIQFLNLLGLAAPLAAGYRAALDEALRSRGVTKADDLPDGELKDFFMKVGETTVEASYLMLP